MSEVRGSGPLPLHSTAPELLCPVSPSPPVLVSERKPAAWRSPFRILLKTCARYARGLSLLNIPYSLKKRSYGKTDFWWGGAKLDDFFNVFVIREKQPKVNSYQKVSQNPLGSFCTHSCDLSCFTFLPFPFQGLR